MKVIVGQISHETNTFSSVTADLEKFYLGEWEIGREVIRHHTGVRDYLGGMIAGAELNGIELIPTINAMAFPSGKVTSEAYVTIKKLVISTIKSAEAYDAICLALHGAGVVEDIEDLEGDLLYSIRQEIGYETPIIVTLDLHANITSLMVEEASVMLSVKQYPHTDSYDIGFEAMRTVYRIIQGEIQPVTYMKKLPLLIPTSTTYVNPARMINEYCEALGNTLGILDVSFVHGFPYADIYAAGVSVICTTENPNELLANQTLEAASERILQLQHEFFPELPFPERGIEQALESDVFPVVINETSDNPGAGTPGDGTYLLSAMIKANIPFSCFGVINDPEVVEVAHRNGVGSTIDVLLGGKTDDFHGESLRVQASVKSLTDGRFIQSSPMWQGLKRSVGRSVRLLVGQIDVIVCSVSAQVFDEQIFLLHGIDVREYRIIGIKSSHHFRASFANLAAHIITVDSPGLSTNQFHTFTYSKIRRPIVPLEVQDEVSLIQPIK
ncbi:M81 family metallopeptidase [Paenibacillus sp. 7124]|uniref:M81 family metallopeptidase n=1 Tax=Paenibacillus apii TaxID=1850370 RepID=A0A6M1PU74_9BACL|nr:M81 family metallopeptidase [Paenibacillus apii]NGM85263.1 M81 family metallopeptidase [Paenibacillus apii]